MAATTANAERYRIEIKRVRRPLAQPLQTGGGHCIAVRESVLLKVTAEADPARSGYGEAAVLPWFGTENADQAVGALAALGNVLRLQSGGCSSVEGMITPNTAGDNAVGGGVVEGGAVGQPQDALEGGATGQPWDALEGGASGQPWQDTLEDILPPAAAHALSATPCARWALECALRQAGALPQLASVFTDNLMPARNAAEMFSVIPVAALLPAGAIAVPQNLLAAGFRVFKIKIGVHTFADEAASIRALLKSLRELAATASDRVGRACATQHAANGTTAGTDAAQHTAGGTTAGTDAAQHTAGGTIAGTDAVQCTTSGTEKLASCPFRLRLDANGSLSASGLQAWLRLLEPFADCVDFIEQPLPVGQERQTAIVFTGSSLAFAFDESLTSLPRLRRISEQFPEAVLVVKPALLGSAAGFLQWRRHNAEVRQTVPCRVVYSSALETGIGLYHALALAVHDPLPLEPVGFGTGRLFARDRRGAPPQETSNIVFSPATLAMETTMPQAGSVPTAQCLQRQMEALWKRM